MAGEGAGHKGLVLLRTIPLFSGVQDPQLAEIAAAAQNRKVARGTVIVRAGDTTDSLYILINGRARVMNSDEEGREVILSILGPGDFFGEMGLLSSQPRTADVVANGYCHLLALSRKDFNQLLASRPEARAKIEAVAKQRDAENASAAQAAS